MKKRKIFQKCKRTNCNKMAYAYGLCHDHYIESIHEEPIEKKKGRFILYATSVLTGIILVLIFAVAVLFGVQFVIYCSRYGGDEKLWIYILTATVGIIAILCVMSGVLALSDNFVAIKITVCILLVLVLAFAVFNLNWIIENGEEVIKFVSKSFTELISRV